ncbi:IpaC/SipC family type III secretion system effector [Yersinia mollaretii]|uniref:IpaC/SipC family type III secretion system effector n=1 Tax=Yersinia mollaretii TaxID=33060 RepID=A0AA44I0Y4_YERMO|nr:IpaC/SipC family type III secretion system effector [Yersinia mollaretii]NIL23892.1 IpaC/SipC family type III secretion system effector [Yersinia mollaretii]CNJ24556.1 membrane protein [Yersinia mollaretii]CNK52596.1 membrane protein [Yersinia enterocolitica]CQQ67074.1 membrane protein [Yersinia mollaretii]
MSTIQQTAKPVDIRAIQNIVPQSKLIEAEQITTSKLNLHDVNPHITDFNPASGRPQLAAPLASMNYDQMLGQLGELSDPDNAERLDDLRIALSLTPEGLKQALTTVIQREVAATEESAGNRALLDALVTDDVEQRDLVASVQMMLVGSLLKEKLSAPLGENGADSKVASEASVKESRFIGIQTSDMMSFLFSMLREVMAEINISERRINSMFANLSADMTEKAAQSTIREGKEIFKSAVIGFATSMAITTAGTAFQARGIVKQNQTVNKHLKPANLDKAQAQSLSRNLNKTTTTTATTTTTTTTTAKVNEAPQSITLGGQRINLGGKQVKQAATPTVTEQVKQAATPTATEQANAKKADIKSIDDVNNRAELHQQAYDQKTNKYRTQTSIAEQMSRMSDNAGQVANTSNMSEVKGAEADKMIQNTASEVARGIASDKEKQIDRSSDAVKEMFQFIASMYAETVKTNQSLVKG